MLKKFCDKCGKEIFGPAPHLAETNSFRLDFVEIAWDYKNNHNYDYCSTCGMRLASLIQNFNDGIV